MAKQKRKHGDAGESIRKITKASKYTYYVTIPKDYITKLGWRERQKVEVLLEGETIIVKDWKG